MGAAGGIMSEVILYVGRGLSGLGKTTWACGLVTHGHGRVARVGRQIFREGLFQREQPMDGAHEKSMMMAAHMTAWVLLSDGFSVVADGTNLKVTDVDNWVSVAAGVPKDVAVEIHDFGADITASRAGVALSTTATLRY